MSLASHTNVYNTCLRVLRQRGFQLRIEGEMTADGCYPTDATWWAEKNGFHFCASNPIELLGLIAIYDFVQPKQAVPYWWSVPGPDIWDELLESAFPDEGELRGLEHI